MSFLNFPVFAVGSLLIAAPIALHLMMRQKPRHAMFPALQFVRRKQFVNERKLKLRNWALLALRCAAIVALATALARPIVASAAVGGWWIAALMGIGAIVLGTLALVQWQRAPRSALAWVLTAVAAALALGLVWLLSRLLTRPDVVLPAGDAEEPLAAVMIFDTSPRMALVQDNESRLAVARKIGQQLVKRLPSDSEIGVLNTQQTGDAFSIDRAAASSQIGSLKPAFATDPLPDAIERGLNLLETSEKERREIYIFTDLTRNSWPGTEAIETGDSLHPLADRLNVEPRPFVYVIDVGSESPGNLALGEVRLSRQHLPPNSALELQVELRSEGLDATRQVQLFVEKPDPDLPIIVDGKPQLPELVMRSQREVTIAANQSQWLDFSVLGFDEGTHHGEIRILGEDGLAIDNKRYFSVNVRPAARILIVAGKGAQPRFVVDALAPIQYRETGEAMFACQVARPEQLPEVNLTPYSAVVLLDPPALPPVVWRDLGDYVRRGGGLATFLGRNADPSNPATFSTTDADAVLPGRLARVWRASDELTIALRENSHPILRVLQPMATSIPWTDFPIEKYWQVKQTDDGHVVLRYSNGKPALLERSMGDGRSMLFTSPISDPLNVRGRPAWSRGTDSWPYLVLVNEVVKYAASGADAPLNYQIGQIASLPQAADDPDRMQMFHPQGTWQEIVASGKRLDVPFTDFPGAYRLKNPPPSSRTRGFAVNLLAEATELERAPPESLDHFLGSSNYQLARDEASIERQLGVARKGYEFYPWMMVLVVSVLALEHLLSNRFYGSQGETDSLHRKRALAREAASKLKEVVQSS